MSEIERRVQQIPVAVERRKGPGRPRLVDGEDTNVLHVRLATSQHDRVCIEALRRDVPVSELIRQALDMLLFS